MLMISLNEVYTIIVTFAFVLKRTIQVKSMHFTDIIV